MQSNQWGNTENMPDSENDYGFSLRRQSSWEDYFTLDDERMDDDKDELYSDHGASVERMIDAIDMGGDYYRRRIKAARKFVTRNAPRLLPVLNLILKNGKNRKESIWSMLKKPRHGHKLRKPITKRSKRFCGSSDAKKPNGGDLTPTEKK